MPKKFIKRFIPSHQSIKDNKFISLFGTLLHDPNLWQLNRRSASGAFGIGLFYAFWPVPFQMWLAAATAIPLRVNLPLSVATVWLTNPFTMPPIFYGAYIVGTWILGSPTQLFEFQLSWHWVVQSLETIGPAFIVGCAACGIFFGLVGYFGMQLLWRLSITKAWKQRALKRSQRL
ncbi:DUF2062 domain-containing protein [Alteromonadaceae bacterium BrNp21-10]|nr:DUF2062 domain-containing protein [Alteromonadaceae bacterium BrNp21-10]